MSIQEKDLVKTENDSCNTSAGTCSTSDANKVVVSKQAAEQKLALEKAHSEKSGGCCG